MTPFLIYHGSSSCWQQAARGAAWGRHTAGLTLTLHTQACRALPSQARATQKTLHEINSLSIPTVGDLLHLLIRQQRPSWCCHSPLLCNNKGNSLATKVPRGLKMSPSHQSPPWDTTVPHSTLLAFNSPECNSTETLYNSFKVTAERTLNKTTPFQQDTASEQCNSQRGGRQIFPAHLKEVPGFQFEGTVFKNNFFT